MSRRGRATLFLVLALAAAALAGAIADGYGSSIARSYGPLRPVVVSEGGVPRGRLIGPADLAALTVRRVPVRFAPPGALASPREALGLLPEADLPSGAYLLASQLRPPGHRRQPRRRLGGGLSPVEISVSGADALLSAGPPRHGIRVEVIVTAEPGTAGPGRTYVAASRVPLLALGPGPDGPGPGGLSTATLGLTRGQALRLISAESYARKVTLLPDA